MCCPTPCIDAHLSQNGVHIHLYIPCDILFTLHHVWALWRHSVIHNIIQVLHKAACLKQCTSSGQLLLAIFTVTSISKCHTDGRIVKSCCSDWQSVRVWNPVVVTDNVSMWNHIVTKCQCVKSCCYDWQSVKMRDPVVIDKVSECEIMLLWLTMSECEIILLWLRKCQNERSCCCDW